jgi:hypothetical protein
VNTCLTQYSGSNLSGTCHSRVLGPVVPPRQHRIASEEHSSRLCQLAASASKQHGTLRRSCTAQWHQLQHQRSARAPAQPCTAGWCYTPVDSTSIYACAGWAAN